MDGGWNHIVARLSHVHVIVWMNDFTRADRLACELCATVRDHFIRVRVRARAGASLKNVERKMFIEFSIDNFLGRLDDERAAMGIQ